ncbi:T9SS type A sorting domain-containing protein [Geofilum rubicundum]|uniref:Secretion system C-terminal sorting domain-containing protein n=1 Tax=Geofilum rubicundum JCM 15548 TaxID=1236989 RepID=A0A0E9LT92_9BACT|nr:T9SS type A sorting domain-containing protein [Geofilum rubicundum]GAO28459.1 hypothetical protein JCM15548_1556 [Geofilum rubicundum JCM 15548]
MKHLSTLFLAIGLMMASTAVSAQLTNRENQNSFKKVRERTLPAAQPLNIKKAQKAVRLKNATVTQHPTSSKHYNWTGDDWAYQQELFYDAQGREIEMISGVLRIITEYDDLENSETKWFQQRASEEAAWTTYRKEISLSGDNWIYEIWELVDGTLAITGGSKSLSWESTDGNTTTDQWESWMYNPTLEAYEMTSGYKDVSVANNAGQTLSVNGYYWENGEWKLEYTDTYTYNNDNQLTQMAFCYYEEGFTECERLEFVYEGAGAPSSAMVYTDYGTGYELTGRYINLVWNDWGNISFDDATVVLFATQQNIIDPDGDLNNDANYENFEQFENDPEGNYTHQYWIAGQWVTDDHYSTVTEENGDVVTTSYYFDYEEGIDENCDLFMMGDKQIMVVGANHTSMTDYEWTKTSEPCGYEWVKLYEVIENTTATTQESITRYMQAEIMMESIEFEEWNMYGHPVVSRNSSLMGEIVMSYEEYSYDNTYDGSLRTSTIISFRDQQDGAFSPTEKIEYVYGGATSTQDQSLAAVQVFPTVFNKGFNVHLPQISTLQLISAQGQTVWQQASVRGQLFVPGSHLPQGVYLLLISNNAGEKETIKLIKR